MSKFIAIFACGILFGLLTYRVAATKKAFGDEFGTKAEWSALQSIEYGYRNKTDENYPKILNRNDYTFIGLSGTQGRTIWILADAENPPFLKTMPSEPPNRISAQEFIEISQKADMNLEVAKYLADQIEDLPNQAAHTTAVSAPR